MTSDLTLRIAERLQWFALTCRPQKEFACQRVLERYGLRTFVPIRREWRRRNAISKAKVLKPYPIAPRYVFAGFEPGVPLWFELFNLPIVSGVVGLEGEPAQIPAAAMVAFMQKTGGGLNAPSVQRFMRTHHEFRAGDRVEITEGPFAGMEVPVKAIEGHKATVLMQLFGGAVDEVEMPVEILAAA